MNGLQNVEQSYQSELIRKAIHLCSLAIPIVYYFIAKSTALNILIPLTLAFGLSDIARLTIPAMGRLYERLFGFLLRAHEQSARGRRLNGATYVLISATICVALFPKVIVITAFAILIISDSSAALIGRRFGRHHFMKKTFEGSAAFFVTALFVVALSPKVSYIPAEYLIGAAAALVGSVVEALSIAVDDNLSIPLSICAVMWAMYDLLIPSINVFKLDALV
jgi:dolichol kinase